MYACLLFFVYGVPCSDDAKGAFFRFQKKSQIARSATALVIFSRSLPCSRTMQVGAELLYIAQAPRLALNDKDFVEFPDVSRITEPYDKKV